ncbi:MAG TPA: hypothetical protein VEY50_04255 [Lysobacter sp.]|nr:hypothetical protein [Lysobacter sp.]
MIFRVWQGRTPLHLGDRYAQFLQERAIPDYRRIAGNLGVTILRRDADEVSHFMIVTSWESLEAIRAFAGEPIDRAKYYDEDSGFLLEFEPHVLHYDTVAQAGTPGV